MKDCTYQVDVVGEPGPDGKRFRVGYKTWHENLDAEGSKDIGESANNTLALFKRHHSLKGDLTAKLDAEIDGVVQAQQSFKITKDDLEQIEDALLVALPQLHAKTKKHRKDKEAKKHGHGSGTPPPTTPPGGPYPG